MQFLPEILEQYVDQHTSPEDDVLKELSRETYLKHLYPQMLSGHYQGTLLNMFVSMIQPKRILEIGTYTGYSGICMARALPDDGLLHTIDINEELKALIDKYFDKARVQDKIKSYIGNAMEIIPTIDETFDLVFIDADKTNYSNYYDMVFDKVRKGGFIIADNVLWSGKVTQEKDPKDLDTNALREYSQKIMSDDRVENILLAVRDGLMIAKKLV